MCGLSRTRTRITGVRHEGLDHQATTSHPKVKRLNVLYVFEGGKFLEKFLQKIEWKISSEKWMKKETKFDWILTEKHENILWEIDREKYWSNSHDFLIEKWIKIQNEKIDRNNCQKCWMNFDWKTRQMSLRNWLCKN